MRSGPGRQSRTKDSKPKEPEKSNTMQIIKAGTSKLKPAELVGKSEHIENSMTGNANFANPVPTVAELTTAREKLVAAIADAQSGAHAAIASKNIAATTLSQLLVRMSRYVNSVAAGDVTKAVSSGFELAKKPDPIDQLEAPTNFEGRTATIAGQVDLRWKGVYGARMYFVYVCVGDPTNGGTWKNVGMCSRGRYVVSGLITDKLYTFRVTAIGRVGEGPVSEMVTVKAA